MPGLPPFEKGERVDCKKKKALLCVVAPLREIVFSPSRQDAKAPSKTGTNVIVTCEFRDLGITNYFTYQLNSSSAYRLNSY